jgi:two-component system sensor histidine kinase KdpD
MVTKLGTSRVARYIASAIIVALVVWIYFSWLHVNDTTVALTLLLVVLFIAARWGLSSAIFTSIVATLALNFFFLPPIKTFTVADPENWIAIVAFLVTAIVSSRLSERAREETKEAKFQRRELQRLYEFSQHLLTSDNVLDLLNSIPTLISVTFQTEGAALLINAGNRIYRTGKESRSIDDAVLLFAATQHEIRRDEQADAWLVPLLLGVQPIGALAVIGGSPPRQSLIALSSLVAIAVERARAVEMLGKTEAAREGERIRSALLDSVAHELRTPLTSITGAVTSLRSQMELSSEQRDELLLIIEEEGGRLNRLIGEAIEMAQLDANEVKLDLQLCSIREPLDSAIENAQDIVKENPVNVRIPDGLPRLWMDPQLMEKVLHHLLENAVKYSSPGSPITIGAEATPRSVILSVADRGTGIDGLEQGMIFDKFYRGQNHRSRIQGTGMGLAIAKAIVEAHGGNISVTSQVGHGSVFSVEIPLELPE